MSQVRKIIKVLAKKAQGLGRKAKLHKMNNGLSALGQMMMRQRRDNKGSLIDVDDLNAVDLILKRASVRR
tara:strand:+ start:585 stop:794 length:210 start_codon:yes stop_codon:yes gene_type:complete